MFKFVMLIAFIVMIISLSIVASKKTKTVGDFVLGGRSIGPWMSAFAYGTTYFSAVLLIGFAGKVGWEYGVGSLLIALGNGLIGCWLAWKVLGARTREMTGRLNVMTMPSFLEARFHSSTMKRVASLIIFIFFVPYCASVFMGLSYLFEQVFQIDYTLALVMMALVSGIYLILGGYLAVALIDFVQGLIMILGIVFMVYCVNDTTVVNGFGSAINNLRAMDPGFITPQGWVKWVGLISIVVMTSLGTWGLPQMVQKFYSIKQQSDIPKATIVSTLFALLITGGAYYVGSTSHLFFSELPMVNGVASPDFLMPNIISQALPEVVAVLILILVLSASMSTLTSLVLVSSSTVCIDLFKGGIFPNMSSKRIMIMMKVLCGVFILFSLAVALNPPSIILTLMSLSWGTVAGAFLGPYLIGLYYKKTTKIAAWTGMVSGVMISVCGFIILRTQPAFISPEVMALLNGWGATFFSCLAIITPCFIVWIVSQFTPQFSSSEIAKIFPEQNSTQVDQREVVLTE